VKLSIITCQQPESN